MCKEHTKESNDPQDYCSDRVFDGIRRMDEETALAHKDRVLRALKRYYTD